MTSFSDPGRPDDDPRVAGQVERAGVEWTPTGGGTVFTEAVLVVNQKAKLIELSNEYGIFDQRGHRLGTVTQVGQNTLRKLLRFFTDLDQFLTTRLEVRDPSGRALLHLTRPGKIFKSRVLVRHGDGRAAGEIVQRNLIGKINFGLVGPDGRELGELKAENWRAWDFAVIDTAGLEVARITKTWEGVAKAMFTTADNYVVKIHRTLVDPMLTLVVAAALTIDTALKQDEG